MANTVTRKNPKGIKDSAISLGIVSAAGVGLYFLLRGRKKEEPLPITPPPPPPPTEIPEIDEIFAEVDSAIAKLEELTKFLKEQAGAAQEVLNDNTALINSAKQALAEAKDKIQNKTLTQSDAEKLLEVLAKLIAQIEANNQALTAIISSMQKALDELQVTINNLKNDIAQLRYQLEPIPVEVVLKASGRTGSSIGIPLSIDQTIELTGSLSASANYPWIHLQNCCCQINMYVRDKVSKIIKGYGTYACKSVFSSWGPGSVRINDRINLSRGLYSADIQILTSGCGGSGNANVTIRYKTARFLVQ